MLTTRTPVHTEAAKQCQVCGQLTYFHELQRRRCAVGESRFYLWRLIPLHSFVQYEPRDLCPICVSQDIADERHRKIRLAVIVGSGVGIIYFWPYLNPYVSNQALFILGFIVVSRTFLRWRYRNRKALIIR